MKNIAESHFELVKNLILILTMKKPCIVTFVFKKMKSFIHLNSAALSSNEKRP